MPLWAVSRHCNDLLIFRVGLCVRPCYTLLHNDKGATRPSLAMSLGTQCISKSFPVPYHVINLITNQIFIIFD